MLAAKGHVDIGLFAATMLGIALVIASACVCNNYIDRGIDKAMARTKRRALVTGVVSGRNALIYATILGLSGCLLLGIYTNRLTLMIGITAFIFYVVLYGLAKRRSVWGTVVGSVPGAAPVVAGYVAVTDRLNSDTLLLFLILTLWQMPHFYAIAMYRFQDYKAAGLPVLPVKKGMAHAKLQILLYAAAFTIACGMLTVFGYTGYTYLVVMSLLSLYWLYLGLKSFRVSSDKVWGRKMFLFSLVVIMGLSFMLALDHWLP